MVPWTTLDLYQLITTSLHKRIGRKDRAQICLVAAAAALQWINSRCAQPKPLDQLDFGEQWRIKHAPKIEAIIEFFRAPIFAMWPSMRPALDIEYGYSFFRKS